MYVILCVLWPTKPFYKLESFHSSSNFFIVFYLFPTVSHLFTTITTALPCSCAYPATRLSCSMMPCSASMTTKTTFERSIAFKALNTEYFSVDSYTFSFFTHTSSIRFKHNLVHHNYTLYQ